MAKGLERLKKVNSGKNKPRILLEKKESSDRGAEKQTTRRRS